MSDRNKDNRSLRYPIYSIEGSDDENLPPPPQQTPTQQAPHTVSTIKLYILKKGEYDIWDMKMEHYLSHIDYPIWEVIQKGNGPMTDANEMWDAIKSRFGGNDESKKMQKYIFKQHQLEIHGAGVSTEDASQKFFMSLPSSWSQVSLVMRTKPGVDNLNFDDLHNNLRVFEYDNKGSTRSSSSAQNVAFVSFESTSSTNDVSTAYGVSTSSGYNLERENSSSYTDELMYSFFANQSSGPHLDHEDLEQLDEFDLEEMDLKWQVATISLRLKKFYKKTRRRLQFDTKEPVDFNKTKVECFNFHNTGHFARECRSKRNQESRRIYAGNTGYRAKDNGRRPGKQEEPKALVTLDGEGSDTEVKSCSKECVESYAKLKQLYDEQREQLGDASIEIQAYTQALKKVEAQLVAHQKNQLWYEEKIRFMKIDLDDKTDMSTRDKSGLGYRDQVHNGVLNYENEVFQSVFDSRSSDVEDSPVHDRFANVEGMHAVPPLMTGNYMPSGPDREVDDSMFTYGPKQSITSESDTQTSNFDSCESNSSVETLESVPEPIVVEPKVDSQPKVWSDAPIIEEYKSDSDDEYVIQPSKEQEKPSFAFVNTVKHVKTPRETVKEQNTYSPSPKADKRDWNGLMSKKLGLGYGFTKKACFVCGSFSHLIRDCDFHEKRMAKQIELNKKKGKGTGQGKNRPVWNNVQRLNHQNKFVPKAVLTKTGIFPVNTARQNLSSQAATTSTARKVNTARPNVHEIRPRNNFYKSHSPTRRPFNRTTTPKAKFSNQKVNTAEVKAVSAVGGIRETTVKGGKLAGYLVVQFVDEFLVRRRVVDDMMTFEVVGTAGTKIHTASVGFYHHTTNGHQFTMSNRHQELASPEQTTYGQTESGKESSNPLMADSLPKTIQSNDPPLSRGYTLGCGEDSLELMELMGYSALCTMEDGVQGISATIDRKVKVLVSEASIKRHLKLEDSEGLSSLPNAEIFEHLANMGTIYPTPTLKHKLFNNIKRVSTGYSRVVTPLFDTMIAQGQSQSSTPQTSLSRITSSPSLSPQTHQPSPSPHPIDSTHHTEEPTQMPYELPLQSVHSLGRDEGSLSLNELTVLCTSLSNKVASLELELKQIKETYNTALTKLILRVKKLEKHVQTTNSKRKT
ncbi:putative ribonuclease H-like domain-containing protein, partial [Tanacetum coccineum]